MPESLLRVVAAAAGLALGALFFGGLWCTVHLGVSSARAAVWFFVSLLVRTGIVLTGFYVVAGGHIDRLLICLVGFVVARIVVTWLTRPADALQGSSTQGVSRAT